MTWAELIKAVGRENAMLKSVLYLARVKNETGEELEVAVNRKFHEDLLKKPENQQLLKRLTGKKIAIILEKIEVKKTDTALISDPPPNERVFGYRKIEAQKLPDDPQLAQVMACLI